MNKTIKLFIAATALIAGVLASATVSAASTPQILSLNANQSGGTISVDGTAETHMIAAAISVWDSTGAEQLAVETTQVDNGAFSHSITIAEGNYKVCAANYENGQQFCVDVTTTEESAADVTNDTSSSTATTPETGAATASDESAATADYTWLIILAATVIVAGAAIIVIAHRRQRQH